MPALAVSVASGAPNCADFRFGSFATEPFSASADQCPQLPFSDIAVYARLTRLRAFSKYLGRQSQRPDAGAVASIGRVTEGPVDRLIARAFGVRTQPRNRPPWTLYARRHLTGSAQYSVVDFGARGGRRGWSGRVSRAASLESQLEWSTSMVHTALR